MLREVRDSTLTLVLDESQAAVYSEEYRKRIAEALSSYFGQSIELAIEIARTGGETPAAYRERRKRERKEQAIRSFSNDHAVKAVVERFKGSIMTDSIEPLSPEES